jgi:hypothetical protein
VFYRIFIQNFWIFQFEAERREERAKKSSPPVTEIIRKLTKKSHKINLSKSLAWLGDGGLKTPADSRRFVLAASISTRKSVKKESVDSAQVRIYGFQPVNRHLKIPQFDEAFR